MALINPPPQTAVDDNGNNVSQGWVTFFSNTFNILTALTQSGTTAQRPIKFLWIGRTYYDTTINRPIWYTGTNWIRADGVIV